jgi:hypothetical protein
MNTALANEALSEQAANRQTPVFLGFGFAALQRPGMTELEWLV